ncbi:MAG TPA: hypothetical protein DEA26_04885 [Oceanospirillales bacterium]|nr:hypothetical protein [Oceanospirillaceae bacterium]HBS41993.1 hypothetical protein [Oceanospirillales bacterium]|tara:strand:- start:1619 stop:2302 length:684 start_codon:yes stop_codon:yes gene_type:complete
MELSPEIKRRIIYTVLCSHLSDEDLWEVMWRWEVDYSARSRFELNRFLADCQHIPFIQKNRTPLYRQIIRLMMAPNPDLLEPDPLEAMQTWRRQAGVTAVRTTSSAAADKVSCAQLMTEIILGMLKNVPPDASTRAVHYALGNSQRKQLSFGIIQMLENGQRMLQAPPVEVSVREARILINLIYVGLCEMQGPVETDNLLSQSIRSTVDRYRSDAHARKLIQEILDK